MCFSGWSVNVTVNLNTLHVHTAHMIKREMSIMIKLIKREMSIMIKFTMWFKVVQGGSLSNVSGSLKLTVSGVSCVPDTWRDLLSRKVNLRTKCDPDCEIECAKQSEIEFMIRCCVASSHLWGASLILFPY